jgi:hypothetical protein
VLVGIGVLVGRGVKVLVGSGVLVGVGWPQAVVAADVASGSQLRRLSSNLNLTFILAESAGKSKQRVPSTEPVPLSNWLEPCVVLTS